MAENNGYYLMLHPESKEQAMEFKAWCKENGVSMNKAFCLIIRQILKGKFVVKQLVKEKA